MNAAAKDNGERKGATQRGPGAGPGRRCHHEAEGTSLWLFEDGEPDGKSGGTVDAGTAHLAAARRIARQMARLADHSAAQLAAGRRICRHLLAMLDDAQRGEAPARAPHAHGDKRPH